MKLIEIKSELIKYARTLIPIRYRNFIRITGTEAENYMRIQTVESAEIKTLLMKNFGQEKFVTHISKNWDIKGIETIDSFEFDKSQNLINYQELDSSGIPLNDFIEQEKLKVKNNIDVVMNLESNFIAKVSSFLENHFWNKEYFDLKGLNDYKPFANTIYNSNTDAARWYKDSVEKFYHLVQLLSLELDEEFQIVYKERPNGQKGQGKIVHKDYVLLGIDSKNIPLKKFAFIKLTFFHLSWVPKFGVEIDLDWKRENNPFSDIGEYVRDKYSISYPVDTSFPTNWYDLVMKIKVDVMNLFKVSEEEILFRNNKDLKCIIANLTWNSNNWTKPSEDKSGHRFIQSGGVAHESWNFDFDNPRNNNDYVYGFAQFTKPPKVTSNENLVIFYSDNKIVGFYGKCEILPESVEVNPEQSYNLIAARQYTISLKNHVQDVKENFLEGKQRVGMIGFNYLQDNKNILNIIDKAIELNLDQEISLNNLKQWFLQSNHSENYWLFQASPTMGYRIFDALKDNVLNTWMVNQYKTTIKAGDKIMLRIGGDKSGIYAFATLISDVSSFLDDGKDAEYYDNKDFNTVRDRVRLRLDYNLINNPIFKDDMDKLGLPGGTSGTNFKITKQQYFDVLNLYLKMNNKNCDLNKILYGPPGTGKTYNTINEAIKIVDEKFYNKNVTDRNKIQERFNELLIRKWDEPKGQIAFCTFHQSFSYEDFVEGIKPLKPEDNAKSVKYDIVDGIFKLICQFADASNNAQKIAKDNLVSFSLKDFEKAVFYKVSLGNIAKEDDKEIYDYCIANNVISIGFGDDTNFAGQNESQIKDTVKKNNLDDFTSQAMNIFCNYIKIGNYVVISYGKNYIRALGKVVGDYEYKPDAEIRYQHFRKVEWIFKDVEIPVAEFYQRTLNQKTLYKLKSELIIPEFFIRENKPAEIKETKNYVLIIDEINRGNVSSIFGELITLIEPTKRSGNPEAIEVVLPYSKDKFSVPANVYLIGTMNTADRSIEALDTALRRRFSFQSMDPKPEIIASEGKSNGFIGDIDLVKMLTKINERIEKLIDKDHKIGHSYFLDVVTKKDLELAFNDKVIPLLEEYFFGDYGKIGLVLGGSFIRKDVREDFEFANFNDYDPQTQQDLKQRAVYKIKPASDWDYVSIYEIKK